MSPKTQARFEKVENDRIEAVKRAEELQAKALELQAVKLKTEAEKAAAE